MGCLSGQRGAPHGGDVNWGSSGPYLAQVSLVSTCSEWLGRRYSCVIRGARRSASQRGYGGGLFAHPFSLNDPPGSLPGTDDITAGGFLYGVQAGFIAQMDNILFGIEADIQGSTIDRRVSLAIDDVDDVIGGIDTVDVDAGTSLDWLATVRPRLGFVSDRGGRAAG